MPCASVFCAFVSSRRISQAAKRSSAANLGVEFSKFNLTGCPE